MQKHGCSVVMGLRDHAMHMGHKVVRTHMLARPVLLMNTLQQQNRGVVLPSYIVAP